MTQPEGPSSSKPESYLHQNEEIFRLLIDAVTDYAIFAVDTEGKVLTWNKGAERLKGYAPFETIGEHFSKFYTEQDIEKNHPAEELRLSLSEGRYEEEGWRVKKDKSRFWAKVVITPLYDLTGKHIGYTKVTQDLTERKSAQEDQRSQEEKFRLMVESVKDYAIFMLGADGKVASWNEGAKKFKGYEAQEIIGHHFSKFYLPEDIKAKKPEMELEIAEAEGRYEEEGWRVRKDGTTFWANVVITALRDRSGKLFGFSKVTRDLSERKKAAEELKSAYEGLEIRVKEKTKQLEEALKSRDEFLSIASHELKTPITAIKMQVQMAQRRLNVLAGGEVDLPKLKKSLDVTNGQITRLILLVDDLLDISRIEAGKLSYQFEKIKFATLLNEVTEAFDQQLLASKNEIKTFLDEDLEGTWDRARIEQVLVNLITNASKYAPGSKIYIFAKQENDKAIISVQDFGPGIPTEARSKIFERFERLGQSKNISGLGLGLYICKKIVNGHGGTLEIKPFDGKGSTFVITIPLHSKSEDMARTPR